MKAARYMILILFFLSSVHSGAGAQDDDSYGYDGSSHYEEVEDDEYLGDSGEMTHMEDLGGGEYLKDDGGMVQMEDMGEGQYLTTGDEELQIDRDED
jgi:hypothetical protein